MFVSLLISRVDKFSLASLHVNGGYFKLDSVCKVCLRNDKKVVGRRQRGKVLKRKKVENTTLFPLPKNQTFAIRK